jgi:hypothetical protein
MDELSVVEEKTLDNVVESASLRRELNPSEYKGEVCGEVTSIDSVDNVSSMGLRVSSAKLLKDCEVDPRLSPCIVMVVVKTSVELVTLNNVAEESVATCVMAYLSDEYKTLAVDLLSSWLESLPTSG